ncbi:FkbM family methyltransferase [Pollutibacter soli]|uniref:FkbM family methyltransferase n=1 Tax=Pollutibacter soli TaxID=3034157 RepID=UPI003013676C
MGLKRTLQFILNHPLNKNNKLGALTRFVKWQIRARLNTAPVVHQFTPKAKIFARKGLAGVTGNIYCGLHDFEDMSFLLHFLRRGDLFLDIGANVGSYTILASGHCEADSISFEPVPVTYKLLQENVRLNKMESRVTALNVAVGSSEGTIPFTSSFDAINHVAKTRDDKTIDVPIGVLNHLIGERNPHLAKIDVEGYETEVLAGGSEVLSKPSLKAIIIELNGAGANFGYDESKIHDTLLGYGYKPFRYDPFARTLFPLDTFGHLNTIYIKDLPFVTERIKSAKKIEILGQAI